MPLFGLFLFWNMNCLDILMILISSNSSPVFFVVTGAGMLTLAVHW